MAKMCFCLMHTHVFSASPSLVMVLGKFPIIKNKQTDKQDKESPPADQQRQTVRSVLCFRFHQIPSQLHARWEPRRSKCCCAHARCNLVVSTQPENYRQLSLEPSLDRDDRAGLSVTTASQHQPKDGKKRECSKKLFTQITHRLKSCCRSRAASQSTRVNC